MRSAVAAASLLLSTTTAALADMHEDRINRAVLGGVTLAYIHHGDANGDGDSDNGGELGLEASFAVLTSSHGDDDVWGGSNIRWFGVYADVMRDFTIDRTRLSIGPELGYVMFGLDGGFLYQPDGGRKGFVARPVLTLGVVTIFYRYGRYSDDGPGNDFHEIGIIGKFPKKL